MKTLKIIATTVALGLSSVSAAQAATVGFDLSAHSTHRNFGAFLLTNTSSDASIETVSLTIGDTRFNFDIVRSITDVGMSLLQGDTRNGGERFDEIAMSFTDFGMGETFRFRLDFDKDSGRNRERARYDSILFNNGTADNAEITVGFSSGQVLSSVLSDRRRLSRNTFTDLVSVNQYVPDDVTELSAVPLPAALPLMLGGLFGLGMFARRRKG